MMTSFRGAQIASAAPAALFMLHALTAADSELYMQVVELVLGCLFFLKFHRPDASYRLEGGSVGAKHGASRCQRHLHLSFHSLFLFTVV